MLKAFSNSTTYLAAIIFDIVVYVLRRVGILKSNRLSNPDKEETTD